MKNALALAVLLAAPASAATPVQNAARLAAEIGAPLAASYEAPRTPLARESELAPAATAALAPESGPLSGSTWLRGSGFVHCTGSWMSGWVDLRGDAQVTTTSGARGTVTLFGNVYVSGSCQNGGGFVNGSGSVSGSGTLYKDGKAVGSARLDGHVFVNQYASGSYVWINQSVSVSGSYRVD